MNIDYQNSRLFKTIYKTDQLKNFNLPEIVFMGRSNVGKSSLINSLLGVKLAKVSQTPGKTRSINYYVVDEKFFLVDLPGFGYASTRKIEMERFSKLITDYLVSSSNINLVCHLIDSRIPPTRLDEIAKNYVKSFGLDYCILLTKVDKLKQSEKSKLINSIKYFIDTDAVSVITYSAKTHEGKKELQKLITLKLLQKTKLN